MSEDVDDETKVAPQSVVTTDKLVRRIAGWIAFSSPPQKRCRLSGDFRAMCSKVWISKL